MSGRRQRRDDPHLEWKVRILSVAIALALAGMYFEERWMTGVALALLAGAALLRLMSRRREDEALVEAHVESEESGDDGDGRDGSFDSRGGETVADKNSRD